MFLQEVQNSRSGNNPVHTTLFFNVQKRDAPTVSYSVLASLIIGLSPPAGYKLMHL